MAEAAAVGIRLHEQFDTIEQQRRASRLGMWIWLVTELLLFSGLFATALTLHVLHPKAVTDAAKHLKFWIGAANTVILIVSSLTMSGAIACARLGYQRLMVRCMLGTAALGVLFILLKAYEYYRDWAEYDMPFLARPYEDADDPATRLFVDLYYVTTGLHAVHLTTGVAILLWVTARASKPDFLKRHENWIEVFGLYWHFIDLIWIIVFCVLYVLAR